MATDFKNELLKTFLENDKKVTLVNEKDDFQLELSLTAAKLFSTHMKEKIEETENELISFDVSEHTKENVEIFVKYLHGDIVINSTRPSDDETDSFTSWEIIVPLIKLSFHFKLRELDKNHLLSVCKQSITEDNVFEAIALMDVYSFDDWNEQCCSVLQGNTSLFQNEQCLETIKEHSQVAAVLFCSLARTALEKTKEIEDNPLAEYPTEYFRSDGVIKLEIPYISKITETDVVFYSDKTFIRNLSWNIKFLKKMEVDTNEEHAAMYVICKSNVKDITWSCQAKVTLSLKQFRNGDDINDSLNFKFKTDASGYGWPSFISWNELIDKSNGYVTDDDSIHLEAHVEAEMPIVE